MKRLILILAPILSLALAGCAGGPKPEARIETKAYDVSAIVRCPIKLGPAPAWPDTRDTLLNAVNDFERQKLLIEGRTLRDQWIAAQAAQLRLCADPPG